MEPIRDAAVTAEKSAWQQTRAGLVQFGFRLLEAVARAFALIVLIFVHRAVDWALAVAFQQNHWTTYHQWLEGGAFVGFSLIYAMLMFDIGKIIYFTKVAGGSNVDR